MVTTSSKASTSTTSSRPNFGVPSPVGRDGGANGGSSRVSLMAAAPSSPWCGAIPGAVKTGFGDHSLTGGDRFTEQQVEGLISRGIDILTTPAMTVQRNAGDHEICNGTGLPGVYQFDCPIISRRADGRVRVIAPSGAEKLVEGDGWTSPRRSRRRITS